MTNVSIILLIVFSLFSSKAFPQDSARNSIAWKPRMVNFTDFKGINRYADDKRIAASTRTKVQMVIGDSLWGPNKDSLTVRVVAYFFPHLSWFKPEAFGNKKLLVHEQLHFDIAELHARQLRQQLATLQLTAENYQKKIKKAHESMLKELRVMQWRYDSETIHGLREDEQRRWNDFSFDELNKLNAFRDTSFAIKVSLVQK